MNKKLKKTIISTIIALIIAEMIALIIIGWIIWNSNPNDPVEPKGGQYGQYEIETFNAELASYEGIIKGTSTKGLISRIITLNASNKETHEERIIYLNGMKNLDDLTQYRTQIVSGKEYKVEFEKSKDGYITKITVTEVA